MAMLKVVFCDLDGTLMNPQHRVSAFTIDVLKKLKDKGIRFVVATGRPYPDVFAMLDRTGLRPDYIITSNGSRIHQGTPDGGRKLLAEHNMDAQAVWETLQVLRQPKADGTVDASCGPKKFTVHIYRNEEWLADVDDPTIRAAFDPSFAFRCLGPNGLAALPVAELGGVHQVWYQGREEDIKPVAAYAARTFSDRLNVACSAPINVEFGALGVDKGTAVTEICALLGLSLGTEAVCFGDSMNDIPMLKLCALPVVMGNARPEVRALIPNSQAALPNSEDGVAKKLKELFTL